MSYSEIVIAPGSGKPLTRAVLDSLNQPVDFSTGTWRADLSIIEYPGSDGLPFAKVTSVTETGSLKWLTLVGSSVVITPDPLVTLDWDFYKYHYELFIQGPNVNSKPERIAHGPFRLDR